MRFLLALCVIIVAQTLAHGQLVPVPESVVRKAFAGREGALVFIDSSSGAVTEFRPKVASESLAPCSTFKIWNALIGLESGIIPFADEAFYRWDGQKRAPFCVGQGSHAEGILPGILRARLSGAISKDWTGAHAVLDRQAGIW